MAKRTQDELLAIFQAVRPELKKYERGTMKARFNIEGRYELWTEKDVVDPSGKKRKELAFAALIIQSNFVGFHFVPVYMNESVKESIHPGLLKLLKGKACFHITAVTPELLEHIAAALQKGWEGYKKLDWVA